MSSNLASALTIILAIAATVVAIVFFLPKNNREKFGKGFARVHDFVNFKTFIIDYILKGLYILATAMCVFGGFFTIFTLRTTYQNVYKSGSIFAQREATTSLSVDNIGTGILIMILGPIIVRIVYELIMLAVVGVKNIVEINKKIPTVGEPETPDKPETPEAPVTPTESKEPETPVTPTESKESETSETPVTPVE